MNIEKLTQPELQFLTKFLAAEITICKDRAFWYRKDAMTFWKVCDKENATGTALQFSLMNTYKDWVRIEKTRQRKLSKIQLKLKKMSKVV